ncbi:hypothetical protein ACP4OV_012817 [Aristida adscensionis]
MKPWYCIICFVFLASLLVASSAVSVSVSPTETMARRARPVQAAAARPDEAFLARLCEQQRGRRPPLPWCKQRLHARRRRLPMPPPSHGGGDEEIDARYGVSKRLVPGGPNKLHN